MKDLLLLKQKIDTLSYPETIPDPSYITALTEELNSVLDNEAAAIRPPDKNGKPGGLVLLEKKPVVLIPDLHARTGFLRHVLEYRPDGAGTVLELLAGEEAYLVFLGDAFHSENHKLGRWIKAFSEFKSRYRQHEAIDEEMRDSLSLAAMLMELKKNFPLSFHFLKGNHENIANEDCDGNYPFGKFAYEGEMVKAWVKKFMPEVFFDMYYQYEKKLPVLAAGWNFLVSHAEPSAVFTADKVINYHYHPEVIYGLTWTGNDQAGEDAVGGMLDNFIENREVRRWYFGGHRPAGALYRLRAGGQYVQINSPVSEVIAHIRTTGDFNPDKDIFELNSEDTRGVLNTV
jgi:hypothetical protein